MEVEDRLDHLESEGAIWRFFKCDRLDVWTDDGPLACPIIAYSLTTMNMATIYASFNARDIDAVLAVLSDDVAWANG
ncbi:hypothetical protein AB9E11_35460, partial [Rhizobium leguminosarum]